MPPARTGCPSVSLATETGRTPTRAALLRSLFFQRAWQLAHVSSQADCLPRVSVRCPLCNGPRLRLPCAARCLNTLCPPHSGAYVRGVDGKQTLRQHVVAPIRASRKALRGLRQCRHAALRLQCRCTAVQVAGERRDDQPAEQPSTDQKMGFSGRAALSSGAAWREAVSFPERCSATVPVPDSRLRSCVNGI
jgi:hypothetical protein